MGIQGRGGIGIIGMVLVTESMRSRQPGESTGSTNPTLLEKQLTLLVEDHSLPLGEDAPKIGGLLSEGGKFTARHLRPPQNSLPTHIYPPPSLIVKLTGKIPFLSKFFGAWHQIHRNPFTLSRTKHAYRIELEKTWVGSF